jgi:tRNA A-37 threonylcarbamoyl transferase component Bud32
MGAVYVAEQLSTQKLRALKLMHPELLGDDSMRRRFVQEASVGARIPSEHVVEVQAAGVDAQTGAPYLVMELLEGENLEEMVRRRGALGSAEVRLVMEQICHAVGAAHGAGIVHRDLKPQNVFLAKALRTDVAFTVKVLDFGISKLLSEQATQTAALGSPLWLAPEQAQRGAVTPSTDVWALGLIAYFLLVGRSFWQTAGAPDASVTQVMYEVLFGPIPAASARAAEQGSSLPNGFDDWFAHCVDRDPAARFAQATAAQNALSPLLPGAAVMPVPALGAVGSESATGFGTDRSFVSFSGSQGMGQASGSAGLSAPLTATAVAATGTRSGGGLPGGAVLGCVGALALVLVLGAAGVGGGYFLLHRSSPSAAASPPDQGAAPSVATVTPSAVAADVGDPTRAPVASARITRPGATAPANSGPSLTNPAPTGSAAKPPGKRRGKVSTVLGGERVSDLPADGQSVVRGLEPRFLACYERGIAGDTEKHFGESIIYWITIGAGGELSQIQTRVDSSPPGVGTCVLGALRSAHFSSPPKGAVPATLIVSFSTND